MKNTQNIHFVVSLREQCRRLTALGNIFAGDGHDYQLSLSLAESPLTMIEPECSREVPEATFIRLKVKAKNDEQAELSLHLSWDEEHWIIRTEMWGEAETGAMEPLRRFPVRRAETLAKCIEQLAISIDDLYACRHLLMDWLSSRDQKDRRGPRGTTGSLMTCHFCPPA